MAYFEKKARMFTTLVVNIRKEKNFTHDLYTIRAILNC